MDGYGVLGRIREDALLRAIPIIAVTAFAMVGDRQKVLAAGFDGYISKPIAPELFAGQLDSLLKKK
jgi:two-component system cell cycle response regulator